MKVRIELTLTVHEAAWSEAYGLEPNAVRDDVKTWARNRLAEHPDGLILGVTG